MIPDPSPPLRVPKGTLLVLFQALSGDVLSTSVQLVIRGSEVSRYVILRSRLLGNEMAWTLVGRVIERQCSTRDDERTRSKLSREFFADVADQLCIQHPR